MTSPASAPATVHRAMPPAGGMPGGLAVPGTGPMPLAIAHFAAAVLFLLAGAAGLVWIAPELAAGLFPSPHVAGVTHLFTLGWLSTTIFGALYQLLPVALGAPVRWPRVGHAGFWTFTPGAALFAAGVAASSTPLHHAGIALLTIGIALGVTNVGASLARATTRDVTWSAVAIAITALASTLVLGVVLLHNLHTGFLAAARLRVLAIHLHVALVGWALVTIVGMSHRLLPMFLLAHGVDARWTRRAVALLATGTVLLATGLALDASALTWAGAAALELGVAAFAWQARLFFRHRVRRRIDAGMRFVVTALVFLVAAAATGPVVLARAPGTPRVATAYVLLGLLGGIVLYVVGHFYKIVPFLAWIAHFRGRMGKEAVPAVADLYSARVATVQWVLMSVAVAIMSAGTVLGHAHCVRVGAVLFAAGVLLFASQIARVARGPHHQRP